MTRTIRVVLAGCMAAAAIGLSGCGGSSSKAGGDASTTIAAGNSAGSTDTTTLGGGSDSDTAVVTDPCKLYSKADMAKQMGADDVTTESTTVVSPKCTYNSEKRYLSAELSVLNEQQMASSPRDPRAYLPEGQKDTVKLLDVSGIGDEAFGSQSKGGVTLFVRTGKTGYEVLLTNAGGGDDAGNWKDQDAMIASAKAILTSVVGS